jgi:Predicted transcriptional regulator
MIFSELYGAYYNAVATLIRAAQDHPLDKSELQEIVSKITFNESAKNIESAFDEERWQLITKDGTTTIRHDPTTPITTLEKRWLKAVYADPRIRLFTDDVPDIPDVEPLFTTEDILVFDRYSDGDPYEDRSYIRNFRLVLDAIRNQYPLSIDIIGNRGNTTHMIVMPDYLEYSEKDDKFRLVGYREVVNLAKIVRCRRYKKPFNGNIRKKAHTKSRTVEFELVNERNALERVLLHFAHFEKQAEKLDDDRYKVTIKYDKDDETEMLIRILSFGPMLKVLAPQQFIDLVKERLISQKSCGL